MEAKKYTPPKWFVIEHMETGLFDWCVCEYLQAAKYVSLRGNRVVITNAQVFLRNADSKSQEFLKKLIAGLEQAGHQNSFYFGPEPLKSSFNKEKTSFQIQHLQKICNGEIGTVNTLMRADFKKVCLLDLRAEQILQPSDKQEFDVIVLGGILGDHPPKDRSKPLRELLGSFSKINNSYI